MAIETNRVRALLTSLADMPRREDVDPLFDGHLDREWKDLTPDEKLDWIWEIMELRRTTRRSPIRDDAP